MMSDENNTPELDSAGSAAGPPEEVDEAVITDTDRFPKTLPTETIRSLQAEELDVLQAKDRCLVEKGMNLFFSNQFREAEALFAAHYCEDCLVASAFGTLGTIRALLSMEQADVDEACQRLLFASSFALQVSPPERTMTKTIAAVSSTVTSAFNKASGFLGRWSKGSAQSPSTPEPVPSTPPELSSANKKSAAQFRAEVVFAESEVLRATLLLLQDSFSAYVKAGLALRRSYNAYARLEQYMIQHHGAGGEGLDRNSVEGVHFGLGCIHIVTSILPPKILTILKALGYMHNRDVGFQHLQRCLESATLRSPLASLFMLVFHGMLPSFALVMIPESVPICNSVVDHNMKQYPVSVIHLWITGRVARLSRDCERSSEVLEQCLAYGKQLSDDLPQLQHFALYDQAMNWCMTHDWLSAAAAYQNLENESNWSKMFFSYAQGCCYEMIALASTLAEGSNQEGAMGTLINALVRDVSLIDRGQPATTWWAKASEAYRRAKGYQPTRLGGRVISIDQFVARRLTTMVERQSGSEGPLRNVVPLPGLELLLIFYLLHQAPESLLRSTAYAIRSVAAAVINRDQGVPKLACQELLALCAPTNGVDDSSTIDATALLLVDGALLPSYNGESVVLLLMLAGCIRDGGALSDSHGAAAAMEVADKVYSSLVDAAVFPRNSKVDEIRWCAPFAFYERAICRYKQRVGDDASVACKALQVELDAFKSAFGRADYHFEMQMQFRLHLTNDFLRQQPAHAS